MRWSLARASAVPLVALLLYTPLVSTTGVAQQAEKVPWSVIATGGVSGAAADTLRVSATLGQPIIGRVANTQNATYQGFWYPRRLVSGVSRPVADDAAGSRAMLRNYPNPFSGSTTIAFALEQRSRVTLEVFDLVGNRVRSLYQGDQEAGTREIAWNGLDASGSEAASGYYLYVLTVEPLGPSGRGFSERRTMFLVR